MATSLSKGFAADLKKLCDAAGDKAELVVRKVAMDIGGQLIYRSPVDSGRFKSNWMTAVGASFDRSTSDTADKSGATSTARLNKAVGGFIAGQTIWITNSLPYAMRLEYGWSKKQAPGGVVRLSVQNVQQAIAKAAAQVRST